MHANNIMHPVPHAGVILVETYIWKFLGTRNIWSLLSWIFAAQCTPDWQKCSAIRTKWHIFISHLKFYVNKYQFYGVTQPVLWQQNGRKYELQHHIAYIKHLASSGVPSLHNVWSCNCLHYYAMQLVLPITTNCGAEYHTRGHKLYSQSVGPSI
jgi:hypothetical protein